MGRDLLLSENLGVYYIHLNSIMKVIFSAKQFDFIHCVSAGRAPAEN